MTKKKLYKLLEQMNDLVMELSDKQALAKVTEENDLTPYEVEELADAYQDQFEIRTD